MKSNDCQLGIAYVWIKGRYNDVAVLHSLDQAIYGEVGSVGRDPVVERSDLVQLVDVLVTLFFGDRVDAGLGVRSPWS